VHAVTAVQDCRLQSFRPHWRASAGRQAASLQWMMQNRRLGRNCILGDEMVRTLILRAPKPLCPQCCRASLQLLACPAHAGLLSQQHVASTPSQVLEPGASLLRVCQRRVYCSTTRGAQGLGKTAQSLATLDFQRQLLGNPARVCQGFTAAHPGRAGPGQDRAVARDAGVPAPAAGHPGALPGRRAAHHARPLEARAGDLDAHGAPPALCLTHPARPAAMLLHFRVRVLRFTRQGPLACCDDRRVHTACG